MSDLMKYNQNAAGVPSVTPQEISMAIGALQSALSAGVEVAKAREDGRTARALAQAQKELEIVRIREETARGMKNDEQIHQRRMALIQYLGDMLTNNVGVLTPEILEGSRVLLQALQGER